MSKSTRGIRAAGIASLAVTLSLGVAAPAFAVEGFTLERIGGEDRYETAALVADEYSATNDNVILANGQPGFYADALAANYLAGVLDAPILLTNMKQIPEYTLDQLDEMNAQTVTVVGGEGVVPPAQVEQLEDEGYTVERVAGDDRFETNADVIAEGGQATDGIGLIATGFDFPDALAAGPFAYQGHPLGLSTEDEVKDSVLDALEADGVDEVLIFGGESVVGPGVEADLATRGITVLERFDGDDRSETSELAAEWALENLDFTDEHVGVASGYTEGYGADALAGGPLEGKEMSPMLITRNVDNADDALSFIEAHSDTLVDGHLFGGPGAVSVAAEAAMEEAGQGDAPASNQDYTVAPGDRVTQEEGTTRQYSVNGLDNATDYSIYLFECADVTTDENGVTTFAESGTSNTADEGAPDGEITVVNGQATAGTPTQVDDVNPVNGTLNFTVQADSGCVVPVVFQDADNDGNLDLDANNQPTEEFGVGGEFNVIPAEAAGGAFTVDVDSVNKDENYFVGSDNNDVATPNNDGTFYYDANDNYSVNGAPATLATFEANLSADDTVEGTYADDPTLVSTFELTDAAPLAPANASAAAEGTTITVTFDESDTATVDQYRVYRAAAGGNATDGFTCPDFDTAGAANRGAFTQIGTVADPSPNADTGRADLEYEDKNLAENTAYCYAVTSVDDGDESSDSAETGAEQTGTVADTGRPTINDARLVTDAGLQGIATDGDIWRLDFSEAMNPTTATAGQFILQDDDGDRILVQCGTDGTRTPATDDTVTEAVCALSNGDSSTDGSFERLTVELLEDAVDRNDATGDNTVEYPLTIVTTNDQVADASGDNVVDLANSDDVVVDRELL